jgi:hypothetical protein
MIEEQEILDSIEYLGVGWEAAVVAQVRAAFTALELSTPYLVETIQDDLLRLAELDDLFQTRLGLKKVDLVEFAAAEYAMSLLTRTMQIIRRIGAKLKIEPDLSAYRQMYNDLTAGGNVPLTANKVVG